MRHDIANVLFAAAIILALLLMPSQAGAATPQRTCWTRIEYRQLYTRDHCRPGSRYCYRTVVTFCK